MKTRIWNLPVRISHWLLAIGFTIAYFSGENEWNEQIHYAFGALAATVALIRIFYGIIGPRYANFKDFSFSLASISTYIKSLTKEKNPFVGHNPLASPVMLSILVTAVGAGLSGYFLYEAELTGMYNEDLWEEVHEIFSNVFLVLVFFHLAGLVVDTFLHPKDQTIFSMVTGDKVIQAEASKQNGFQKFMSVLMVLVPLLVASYAYSLVSAENGENSSEHEKTEQHDESDDDDD